MAEPGTIYFLDTSALVKLYYQEQGSEVVERWAADTTLLLWLSDLARLEFHSVFARKVREGELTDAVLQTVLECFRADLRNRFQVMPLSADILERAVSLLLEQGTRHALRTLDALHLASAQALGSADLIFVTADRQQYTVAFALFPQSVNPEEPGTAHDGG